MVRAATVARGPVEVLAPWRILLHGGCDASACQQRLAQTGRLLLPNPIIRPFVELAPWRQVDNVAAKRILLSGDAAVLQTGFATPNRLGDSNLIMLTKRFERPSTGEQGLPGESRTTVL